MLFFCPTEKLVEQQFRELDEWFPDINVEWLVGGDMEDKASIQELLTSKTEKGKPLCQVGAVNNMQVRTEIETKEKKERKNE